jgi:hypothetical protein
MIIKMSDLRFICFALFMLLIGCILSNNNTNTRNIEGLKEYINNFSNVEFNMKHEGKILQINMNHYLTEISYLYLRLNIEDRIADIFPNGKIKYLVILWNTRDVGVRYIDFNEKNLDALSDFIGDRDIEIVFRKMKFSTIYHLLRKKFDKPLNSDNDTPNKI